MTNQEHAKEITLALQKIHAEKENIIDVLITECIMQEILECLNSTLSFIDATITDAECEEEAKASPFDDTVESIRAEHKKESEEYMKKYHECRNKKRLLQEIIEADTEVTKKYEEKRKKYQHLMY